jgi:ATP-binding cassette subfamily B protein
MKNIRRAIKYLGNYWQPTLGGGLALLIVNAANLATPQLLRALIDQGIMQLNMSRITQVIAGLVAIALVRGIFNFLQGYWSEMASQGVAYEMRNDIFEKLQNLSFSYHDQAHTGKLMTRMTSDVELVRMFVGRGALMMASALLMITGTMVLMFQMNWQLALVVFIVLPVILVIFSIFVRKIMPVSRNVQKKLGLLNSVLQENLVGMRVVKAFARELYEIERYAKQNDDLLEENINLIKLFVSVFPVIFYIANLGMVAVVWVGGLLVINTSLSLGELVAFTAYLGLLLMPIFQMGMIGAMLSRAVASADRVFEVIDAESEVQESSDALELPIIDGKVVFDDVSFRYVGGTQDVLTKVSFSANPGETIAVLGQTGAGKSSIINLIPRFYDVTGGKILVDGYDIRDLTVESLRNQVGIVLQETTLFSGTIRENIAYGRPEASLKDIQEAAQAAQAHDFIVDLADGYDALVGERGVGLSGGQKQRLAIARALLINPRILILDDSTSSVDAETEYKIQQALIKLMEGRTSFVIAQRISTVRNADQILLLDQGLLVAQGRHADLLETSELYVDILATQFYKKRELGKDSRQEVTQ